MAVQWGPMLGSQYYGHHSKILSNFIIDFVICKWSQIWQWRRPGGLPAASTPLLSGFLAIISLAPLAFWALTGLPDPLVTAGGPPASAGAWAQVRGGSLHQGVWELAQGALHRGGHRGGGWGVAREPFFHSGSRLNSVSALPCVGMMGL